MSVLTEEHIAYLDLIADLAKITQIDEVIIESGTQLRAIDPDRTVVLLSSDVPEFPVPTIGLARLNLLLSRLNIIRKSQDFEVSVKADPSDSFALALNLKSKSTKIDFRCSRPDTIKAPRSINDEYVSSFSFDASLTDMIANGQRAMKADIVAFEASTDGELHCEIKDINGDSLMHKVDTDPALIEATGFYHRYNIVQVMSIMKTVKEGMAFVSSKGILMFNYNNVQISILPRVV